MGMADGYAQASGGLAVVNLHVAPGLGNAMGMLYDAQKAGSPIIVTAGQHEQRFNFTEPLLWADLPTIARPFVKWSAEVRQLSDLPRAIHRAAKTALAPPTGPVFLSLPGDILLASEDLDLGEPTRVASARAWRCAGDCRRGAIAGAGAEPGDHRRRCGAAGRCAGGTGRAGGVARRAGVRRGHGQPRDVSVVASAVSRRAGAAARRDPCPCWDSMICCCRSARICSRCRCRAMWRRCRTACRWCISTPIRGSWARTIPQKSAILGDPKATLPELTDAVRRARSAGGHAARGDTAGACEGGGRGQAWRGCIRWPTRRPCGIRSIRCR